MEEQQRTIQNLQEQLRLALRRQFGPRHEFVDVDQLSLLAELDDGTVLMEPQPTSNPETGAGGVSESEVPVSSEPATRRQAVRILRDLSREIRIIDLP